MGVDSKHPLYTDNLDQWTQVRDTHEGQHQVKEKGGVYLPPTSGMQQDGMNSANDPGWKQYDAYRLRAVVPDIVRDAVEAMIGVMHHKPPVIELPATMEPLREKATLRNESLEMLLRRINEEQLITGRLGLLTDMPKAPSQSDQRVQASGPSTTINDLPYIALYTAEAIINWDKGRSDGIQIQNLNLVVLDESEYERDKDFEWVWQEKYRVLILGEAEVNEPQGQGVYSVGVFRDNQFTFSQGEMVTPSHRGTTLQMIPFTFINSCDIVPEPDQPPLLGLSNLVLTIYRGEADYRQSLFNQGQDTLVTIGANLQDEQARVGANARLDLPTDADAKYIGVDSSGLSEQREALTNDYNRAAQKGGQLLDSVSRERESGEALTVRVAARTATLNQIAITGAFGLQQTLRHIATWIGANPEEVVVTPNLDFVDNTFAPADLVQIMAAKNVGAPISYETIHMWLQNMDVTELDFEEEIRKIQEEDASLDLGMSNPDDLEEDDDDDGDEDDGSEDDGGSDQTGDDE
ncbi:62 kDa structural protein [Alphaproteobacteria phage PhiJL001]|uniref:62 kDa structural protein n=1 Tax=Alphaproteobacteria phage PhiJL001 TaxID=2681607 RepID=Q5DN45_9CAUD|nr:portal protein [Alphaproteobacteria phage PhiJL001]AAT69536.1 62 kDa structural protein [Alphaproteobacteria phage PhiJL001]